MNNSLSNFTSSNGKNDSVPNKLHYYEQVLKCVEIHHSLYTLSFTQISGQLLKLVKIYFEILNIVLTQFWDIPWTNGLLVRTWPTKKH